MNEVAGAVADDQPQAILLDVGHGNAAIFIDGDTALIIDAGSGDLVTRTLERHRIREITAIVISHRHHDHTSELPALLSNKSLCVRQLFINADPNRRPASTFERQLIAALNDSHRRNQTRYHQANVTLGGLMGTPHLSVDVLSPRIDLAVAGVGAVKPTGGRIHPHALAVVLRVGSSAGRSILFGADLEHEVFRELIADEDVDLAADVLVYPHHGGLSGAGTEEREQRFAMELARAVNPELVVFSNGREKHSNPRKEVVRGVRAARDKPKIRVICTQLSKNCSAKEIAGEDRYDPTLDSAGRARGLSCSGSLRLNLVGPGPILPLGKKHAEFVLHQIGDSALCLGEELPATDEPAVAPVA